MPFKMLANKRNCVLKVVACALLLYLCLYMLVNGGAPDVIRELQQSGRSLAALDAPAAPDAVRADEPPQPVTSAAPAAPPPPPPPPPRQPGPEQRPEPEQPEQRPASKQPEQPAAAPSAPSAMAATDAGDEADAATAELVRRVTRCLDRPAAARTQQRGDYWVLYNYVRADAAFRCHESVTYTTHADYSFLDNVVPLVEHWRGPVSVALHAPGADFQNTVDSIAYLRDCASPLVRRLVTFHVYFSTKHVPRQVPRHDRVLAEPFNCSLPAPFANVSTDQMYKSQKKLLYPVNVGRNVARESAQTHFVMASDIELYPSPRLIPQFLQMVAAQRFPAGRPNPHVFALHLFEVSAAQRVPGSKAQLQRMLRDGTALPFHKKLCAGCHNVPRSREWQLANESAGLHVFHVGKRTGNFVHWEPIFVGTHADPLYDERLSWEGKSDKMTQGYALCVLDYDFMILDNAFLVHKPGIKVYKKDQRRAVLAAKTNQLIKKIIVPELRVLYGARKGCAV